LFFSSWSSSFLWLDVIRNSLSLCVAGAEGISSAHEIFQKGCTLQVLPGDDFRHLFFKSLLLNSPTHSVCVCVHILSPLASSCILLLIFLALCVCVCVYNGRCLRTGAIGQEHQWHIHIARSLHCPFPPTIQRMNCGVQKSTMTHMDAAFSVMLQHMNLPWRPDSLMRMSIL
jgi:hypothetical protein